MIPAATHDTIQAHLDDRRRDAAGHRNPSLPRTPRSRPMHTFTTTIDIARPLDEVFAFLEDFTHVPLWNYWVQRVTRATEGSIRVGTRFHQTRRDDHQTYQVIDHQPDRRIAVRTIAGQQPAFTRTITMGPTAEGTRVVDDWELDTGHPPVLQRLARPRIRDGIATNLAKLKDLLENGHTVLPDGRTTAIDHERPHALNR